MWNRSLLYLAFFLYHLKSTIAGSSPTLYSPKEYILLACGSSGNSSDVDDRVWIGDVNSSYFRPEQSQNQASTTTFTDSVNSTAAKSPYKSARISFSSFTYTFPLSAGAKFIRLYFYSTGYRGVIRSKAILSVKAGPFMLLSNFRLADFDPEDIISREYCVSVKENQMLNITFTPSVNNSYAFINGIEILSMPPYLYYTSPNDEGLHFIGHKEPYGIKDEIALEMVYRINVGDTSVSPGEDSGFFRSWSKDADYFVYSFGQVTRILNSSANLTLIKVPTYTAPPEVYLTARTMWDIGTVHNLTWNLPVDSGFVYLVRLHFCEVRQDVDASSQKVFLISIADQIAEKAANVMLWSGGNDVPVYRDYVVSMFDKKGEKKINLHVTLQVNPDDGETLYPYRILNGIEIFKTSFKGNLAEPRRNPLPTKQQHNKTPMVAAKPTETTIVAAKPTETPMVAAKLTETPMVVAKPIQIPVVPGEPTEPPKPTETTTDVPKPNWTIIIAGVGGGILGFAVVLLLVLRFLNTRRRKSAQNSNSPIKSMKTRKSSLPSKLCHHFSLTDIKAATNNFDQTLIIGVGGFGNVYKGYIDDGANPVAIKRLTPGSQQGAHEFKTEIEMLTQLHHRHLVSLIGYCDDGDEMILIYNYMARGTLRDHLCNTNHPPLPWKQRLKISIGAARGLNYLHTGVNQMIIHRDVKTTNILLDEKWVAKVSDFGLSKMGPSGIVNAHISTIVKGTFGYLDPEYFQRQQLTQRSDVYLFGVVLCEVLCGKPPIFHTTEMQAVSLADWVSECYHNDALDQMVDPLIGDKIVPESLMKFDKVAVNCLHDRGTKRPSMNEVVRDLELALQLQEGANQDLRLDEEAVLTTSMFDGNNGICSPSCGEDFSEIMSPRGR